MSQEFEKNQPSTDQALPRWRTGGYVPYGTAPEQPQAALESAKQEPPASENEAKPSGTWYGNTYATGNGLRTPPGLAGSRPPQPRPPAQRPPEQRLAPRPKMELQGSAHGVKKRARLGGFQVFCLLLLCALAGGGAGVFVVQNAIADWEADLDAVIASVQQVPDSIAEPVPDAPTPVQPLEPTRVGNRLTAEEVFELGREQVVGVTTELAGTNIFGQATTGQVSGSGFIISDDGYILTNYHVIEGASRILVVLADGTVHEATMLGGEHITSDLAVLKIEAEGLPAAQIGNSDELRVGASIYAIGNPLGELTHTITSGIVSALDRTVAIEQGQSINMFQIDAAVNTGNSGGPVYNEFGEVVGIVTAKASETGVEGIGFAIPIGDAMRYASQLIDRGYIARPHLGILPVTVTESYAYHFRTVVGVFVNTVYPDTAADRGGILEGDIITALDGNEVRTVEELRIVLNGFAPGDQITVTVFRDRDHMDIVVVLGDRPDSE